MHPRAHSPGASWLEDWTRIEEAVIESIRIVLADLPQLAADMLERALAEQPDMEVVARLPSSTALLQVARKTAPDVVIVGMTDPELPPRCLDLFAENVGLTVLGFQDRHGVAHLYHLRPYHLELGEVAPPDIVREIRNAAGASPLSKWRATRQSPR